jgi:asparagine synthase (glutamine-hydrolysing)
VAFPGRPCDETAFSRAVVEMWRLPSTCIEGAAPLRERVAELSRRNLDVPPHPNSLVADPLRELAAEAGVRLLLTGFGGDDFFTGSPGSRFALLREGRPIAWSRAMIGAALPESVRARLRPTFGSRPRMRPWIRPEFAARTALADRLRSRPHPGFPTQEQQAIYRGVTSLIQLLGDEMEDRAAHAAGLVQRHPFYDRRVAEFGLALPAAQRSDGRDIKLVVRGALRDYLPPTVAARTTLDDKAEFSSTYIDALESIGGRDVFHRLRSEEAGWVDGRVIRENYEDMIQLYSKGSDAYISFAGPLWSVAALEFWLDAGTTEIPRLLPRQRIENA